MGAACSSTTQNQRTYTFRILQGEFLCNHAPHRNTEYMRALHLGGIEDGGCVRGHQCDGINAWGYVTLSHAAIIQSDRAVGLSQNRAGAMPHVGWIAEAHDEQQRFARALFIPVNLGTLIFNKRHGPSEYPTPHGGPWRKSSNQIATERCAAAIVSFRHSKKVHSPV